MEETVEGMPAAQVGEEEQAVTERPPQPAASRRLPNQAAAVNGRLHQPSKEKQSRAVVQPVRAVLHCELEAERSASHRCGRRVAVDHPYGRCRKVPAGTGRGAVHTAHRDSRGTRVITCRRSERLHAVQPCAASELPRVATDSACRVSGHEGGSPLISSTKGDSLIDDKIRQGNPVQVRQVFLVASLNVGMCSIFVQNLNSTVRMTRWGGDGKQLPNRPQLREAMYSRRRSSSPAGGRLSAFTPATAAATVGGRAFPRGDTGPSSANCPHRVSGICFGPWHTLLPGRARFCSPPALSALSSATMEGKLASHAHCVRGFLNRGGDPPRQRSVPSRSCSRAFI